MSTRVGEHEVRHEPPDGVHIVYRGAITPADFNAVGDAIEAMGRGPRSVFMLIDISDMGSVDAGARRAGANDRRTPLVHSVACVGGGFQLRVLFNMLLKAAQLVYRHPMSIRFFATESEARQWLDAQRART
jgi:hypothetical protein